MGQSLAIWYAVKAECRTQRNAAFGLDAGRICNQGEECFQWLQDARVQRSIT